MGAGREGPFSVDQTGQTSGEANGVRLFFAATIVGIALYVVLDATARSLSPH